MSDYDAMTTLYEAVSEVVSDSYRQQAADEGVEWTQDHNEFVETETNNLYAQINQAVEIYFSHLASPLPDFSLDPPPRPSAVGNWHQAPIIPSNPTPPRKVTAEDNK